MDREINAPEFAEACAQALLKAIRSAKSKLHFQAANRSAAFAAAASPSLRTMRYFSVSVSPAFRVNAPEPFGFALSISASQNGFAANKP